MTEAFEIGVSLALQDGVSDAIGKARRDVAALELAVRESGVSLRSLRDMGVRSASVSFAEQRQEVADAPSKRAVQDVTPRLETDGEASRSEAHMSPGRDVEPPRLQEVVPERSAEAPAPPHVVMAPREVAAAPLDGADVPDHPRDYGARPALAAMGQDMLLREAAPVRGAEELPKAPAKIQRLDAPLPAASVATTTERPQDRVQTEGASVNATAAAAPLAPLDDARQGTAPIASASLDGDCVSGERASASDGAPVAVTWRVLAAEPQTPLSAVQAAAPPVAPATGRAHAAGPSLAEGAAFRPESDDGPARPMSLVNALRVSGGASEGTQGEDRPAEAAEDVPAQDHEALTDRSPREAGSPAELRGRAPLVRVAAAGAREKSADQTSHGAAPTEGDVFLDGVLVGRWMSRFLNREAERASAGPTGFDARRGRLLPGVTVGG